MGGQARRSFEAVRDELTFRLERVVEEFDLDERISELREDARAVRRLTLLGRLRSRLQTKRRCRG